MIKTIIANEIKRIAGLKIPPPGKRCHITINDVNRVEMVYNHMRTKPGGVVWFFICPVTGKRCRKLHFINGRYVHASRIKGYYRNNKPAWYTESKFNDILKLKQAAMDSEKLIGSKHFKTHYAGKPTKRFLKCSKHIQDAGGISMHGIVNGEYDSLL